MLAGVVGPGIVIKCALAIFSEQILVSCGSQRKSSCLGERFNQFAKYRSPQDLGSALGLHGFSFLNETTSMLASICWTGLKGLFEPSKLLKVCFLGDDISEVNPDPLNEETTSLKVCINCFWVETSR